MGFDQEDEDVTAFIERSLGIDASHLKPCVSERGNTVSCLVHESWLKEIISGNHSNTKYVHPSSEYERQLMLQPSHSGPYPPWVRICIKILRKPILVKSSDRSIGLKSRNRGNGPGFSVDLTVAEVMEIISKDIYQQNWNSALESYSLAMSYLPKSQQTEVDGQKIIRQLAEKIFGLSVIKLGKKESKKSAIKEPVPEIISDSLPDSLESSDKLQAGKSNVMPIVCALENDEAFVFVEPFFRHDLKDISLFSPVVVSHSTCRILYIIYQVLHGFSWFHSHGITFGKFGLDSIRLDKGLFLYLTTPSFKDVISLTGHQNQENIHTDECDETRRSLECDNNDLPDKDCPSELNTPPEHDLMTLVDMWVRDEITNYDYLMALNYFAGRRHGDPNYHPLFPWVTDFTTQYGGYRDLTKSKFRLNKGDSQLDMTYKQALLDTEEGGGASVAHHVSDVLSDITFHAYLARRTPISVLCEHLRSNWVPNEYPSTMERLYSWTPDECIPQFFSDPTIFKSIHKDLPDLELPSWTPTAEEFIKWHREVLESDEVSRNLHQWIDLTFGYKLSGKAAVRAKNVCLHLVSKNQDVNNYGIVQLFTKPHPAQCKMSDLLKITSSHSTLTRRFLDSGSLQPFSVSAYLKSNLNESSISLDSIDEAGRDSSDHNAKDNGDDSLKTAEDEKIFLPDDCNPLKLLDTYEAIHKFKRQFAVKNKSNNETERPNVSMENLTLDKLIQRDMEALGCIIVEMVIPDKVRLVSAGLSRQQKMVAIKKLCATNPKLLPRYLRSGVLRMMKVQQPSSNGSINTTSDLYQWVEHDDNVPSLNAGLLLHPRTGIFPFPLYFKELHLFLMKFTKARLEDRYRGLESSLDEETSKKISPEGLEHCFSNKSEYSTSQIDVAADFLPSLLPDLDEEGIHLLIYHIEPLFTNYETRLYAFTRLFDCLAQCLGPKSTFKTFLKPLIELCDSRLLQNYEHLAAQSFLSQIIVRFGLDVFLTHFVSFAVDAVAFELMLGKTKRSSDRISVNSNEGIPVDNVDVETGKKKQVKRLSETKRSLLSLSEDDAPGSDQEEEDYINRYDDLEEQNDISKRLFTYEEEEELEEGKEVESQDEACSANEIGGLVVLTKEDRSDLNEEEDAIPLKNEDLPKIDGSPKTDDLGECNTEVEEQGETHQQLVKSEYAQNVNMPVEERMEEDGNIIKTVQETDPITINQFEEHVFPVKPDDVTNADVCAHIVSDETENSTETNSEQNDEEEPFPDDASSEDSSNDERLGEEEHPETNQSDFPSADVFYQDTKAQDSKTPEQNKEDLSPLFVSGIAAESVMWLAPRLGPVLTSQYLAKQLLTMLPQCYMDVLGVAEFELEDEDRKAKWVLYCLGNFCTLYGEAFVLHQYLPFAEKTVKSIHSKITARGEASLAAIFALIKYCVPYISKETLIENFEFLFKTVFQPVLRILSSWNTKFPGGGDARAALCHNYVDLLTVLSLKLERELAKELMTAPLQQFFSCFELVHMKKKEIKIGRSSFVGVSSSVEDDENSQEPPESPVLEGTVIKPEQIEAFYKTSVYEELCQTFSAAMAHHAYVPLCGIMGSKYMEGALYNHDLIWNLCCSHDAQLSHPGPDDVSESRDTENDTQNDECDAEVEKVLQEEVKGKSEEETDSKTNGLRRLSSRRIRTPSWLTGRLKERRKSQYNESKPESTHTTASDQYLKGSWLDHWKYQLESDSRSRGSLFEFQQIKLQTFTGHSGPVRSIFVQDSEHFFLSASKDKTVKLWSLSNHGDGTAQSASSWTYYSHSRAVFSVDMVDSLRQAVSCDGCVHIWDPVQGTTIATLEPNKNSYIVAMVAMPAPSQTVVVATTEATARFIDVRQSRFVQEWKTTTSNAAGSIRDICCSPDGRWVALGYASGLVSVLDVRGGLLRSQRRAHTSDVVQVSSFSNNSLFTSSMDQGLSLWRDDGAKLKTLKGHTEPLNVLRVQSQYIISSSIANRIGVHELVDEQSEGSYTSYKLVPEVFRGNVTSLGYLQLNQLLLLGGDTGNITLCA